MNRIQLRESIRFVMADTPSTNRIFRESLTARPGNIIDGNNRLFFLLNRRITSVRIYDEENVDIAPAFYSVTLADGRVEFTVPPIMKLYTDYSWQKLTDSEMDQAIDLAASSGNFDPNNVPPQFVDYAVKYAAAYCWDLAASMAAEYYTMSAAGKQVSKSELFNHFKAMKEACMDEAKSLRTDQRTDRGDRDIPAADESAPDWVQPYFPTDGGF